MKHAPLILAALFLVLPACNKAVDPPTVAAYQQAAGSHWTYTVTARIANLRILEPGTVVPDTVQQWTVQTWCDGSATLQDTVPVTRFRSLDSDGVVGVTYYRTVRDSLFWYAYLGLAQALPKRPPALRYRVAARTFASAPELVRMLAAGSDIGSVPSDSIVYEEHPPKALVFPLRAGLEWTFRERGYPLWLMHKKVTGTEAVVAAGASLPCYVVSWFWDLNNDGMWDSTIVQHDYFHSKGLVRRSTLIKDIVFTSDGSTPVATADMSVDYLLTSTNIN